MTWTKISPQRHEYSRFISVEWDFAERNLVVEKDGATVNLPLQVVQQLFSDNGYEVLPSEEVDRVHAALSSHGDDMQAMENRALEAEQDRRLYVAKHLAYVENFMLLERELKQALQIVEFDTKQLKEKEELISALQAKVARLKVERDDIVRLAKAEIDRLREKS